MQRKFGDWFLQTQAFVYRRFTFQSGFDLFIKVTAFNPLLKIRNKIKGCQPCKIMNKHKQTGDKVNKNSSYMANSASKMKRILHSDWLPERARYSGFPALVSFWPMLFGQDGWLCLGPISTVLSGLPEKRRAGPSVRGRSAGSFPHQRLVIEPRLSLGQ